MRQALGLLFTLAAAAATAQVSARTGVPAHRADPDKQFTSPMILSLPFARLVTMPDRTATGIPGLADYWCEDARIVGFGIERRRDAKKSTRLDFTGWVEVLPSFDRVASVTVTIQGAGPRSSRAVVRGIDAEEKKKTPFRGHLVIPEETMTALASDPEGIQLEIVLTLEGNE